MQKDLSFFANKLHNQNLNPLLRQRNVVHISDQQM